MQNITFFQECLIVFSECHVETLIPYYTHMQQAQPGSLGHYMLAFVERLQMDFEDCKHSFSQVNLNPLGTVGRCGTSWPIDRHLTTELLGFDGLIDNSMLGRDADYAIKMLNCISLIMSHLYDFATDLHLWSTREFNYIDLDKSHCGTSSIFPNKKNPVLLEKIRSEAGAAATWVSTAYATCRGEGTGDHSVHSVPHLVPALEVTSDMLLLADDILKGLKVNIDHTEEVLAGGWTTTTSLANALVQNETHRLNFRQAHNIVRNLVAICEAEDIGRRDVSPAILSRASLDILEDRTVDLTANALQSALDPRMFVESCVSTSGVAPSEVKRMLRRAGEKLSQNQSWVISQQQRLTSLDSTLCYKINEILANG